MGGVDSLLSRPPITSMMETKDTLYHAHFRLALDNFAAGATREEAGGVEWLEPLAKWRFVSVVETTVEAKHARVQHASRLARNMGPVRVSLSNRLPLLERWLLRNQVDAGHLVQLFGEARSLKAMIGRLGVERHPALKQLLDLKEGSAARIRPVLAKILYGVTIEDSYRSVADLANEHAKAQRAEAAREKKLITKHAKRVGRLTFADVKLRAMKEHLLAHANYSSFYSVPRHVVCLQALGEASGAEQT